MDKASWQRIETLFDQASQLPPPERESFLKNSTGGDTQVYEAVVHLLEQAELTGGFFSELGAELQSSWREGEGAPLQAGDRLGPYEVKEEIGRGGMAVVYLAQRMDGAYQEQVAIKVLKKGLDTEAILNRFRHEQQLLVDLRHPHIANLLDGGETASGQPYLVMEYIEGRALTQYLEAVNPTQADRLKLFLQIATAVQHAHQQLVVHRDLKPSNILVDQAGQVKLLDFGIAKLLTHHPSAHQIQTQVEQRVLTPRYAAPEQKAGGRISTATDVYQLGLILGEMLQDPQGEKAEAASGKIPKDLAAIIGLACREEPERRYPGAGDMKLDVENFLSDRPVKARPESWGYLAQKFIQRNRLLVSAGVLLLLTLSTGIVTTSWQARRAAQALKEETEQRKKAEAVSSYLKFLFSEIDPFQNKDSVSLKELSMLEFVDLSRDRTLADEEQDLALKIEVLDVIAELYFHLGEKAESYELFSTNLTLSGKLPDKNEKSYVSRIQRMASSAMELGKYQEADSLFQLAIKHGREAYGSISNRLAIIYNDYSVMKAYLRQYPEADSLLELALGILSQVDADSLDVTNYAQTLLNHSDNKRLRGDKEGARQRALEAVSRLKAGGFASSVYMAQACNILSKIMLDMDSLDQATGYIRKARSGFLYHLGPNSHYTALTYAFEGVVKYKQGDFRGQIALLDSSKAIFANQFGTETMAYQSMWLDQAKGYYKLGKYDSARSIAGQVRPFFEANGVDSKVRQIEELLAQIED